MEQQSFLKWCEFVSAEKPGKSPEVATDSYIQHRKPDQDWSIAFTESIIEHVNNGSRPVVTIKHSTPNDLVINSSESGPKKYIEHLLIMCDRQTILLRNLWINSIRIPRSKMIDLNIQNCHICKIQYEGVESDAGLSRSTITNTDIGLLTISTNSIVELFITSGSVLGIECPVPGIKNPFKGSVLFRDVSFPKRISDGFINDAQPYRNMRYHLRALENVPMADLFHSLELRIDEELETKYSNKFFSYIYRYISNYGSSTSQPILCIFIVLVISFTMIYYFDGAVLASDNPENYIGSAKVLLDCKYGDLSQALYLTSRPIINPLGIFRDYGALVKPENLPIAILVWFESLLIYLFLVLFIFALRRRFKLS